MHRDQDNSLPLSGKCAPRSRDHEGRIRMRCRQNNEDCLSCPSVIGLKDGNMTPIDPRLACFEEQPASQTNMSSSDFDNCETQVSSNSAPITETPTSIPTMPGISGFDPLVTTTWPPSGMFSTQRTRTTSGPGSDNTRQTADFEEPITSGNNSGKRSQQDPTNDMSTTVDPINLDTRFGPWPEIAPNKRRKHSAGAQTIDESYQTTPDTGSTPSERMWWPRENTAIILDEEPDSEEDHKGLPSDNVRRACSPAQPQPSISAGNHRESNRLAATKCRAKAKANATELEITERETESQHQELSAQVLSLQNEVLALKNEVLMHGNCDSDVIQQYLANAAKRVVGWNGLAGRWAAPSPGGYDH